MNDKLFSIYRSSAGSGKTRTLAKEYLKLAMRFRADYYKHILAVTFTNKATQEMKDRILHYLNEFAHGRNDLLAEELMDELNIDAQSFQLRAQELQIEVLHHYSQFSISTIDAFFQKVIRSFTREAGLSGDYRLEIDQHEVIAEVINQLVAEVGTNKELTAWVLDFAKDNLENDRAWDIRTSLIDFTHEIFREEFRSIENQLAQTTTDAQYFKNFQQALRKSVYECINPIKEIANQTLQHIHANGWREDDFKYSGGPYAFLVKMANIHSVRELEDEKGIGKRPRKEYLEIKNWSGKASPYGVAIEKAAENILIPAVKVILHHRDREYRKSLSAEVVLTNFYAFGLVADLSRKLREYKEENNMMLLADAATFLNGIISESDTPFIYEKVGSFYRNYLIDEFQDTSGMQWKNFMPLLLNSLDQGYPCTVVGDVKQSIYRWRGGDLKLLQQDVEQHIGSARVAMYELSTNFRSAVNVVEFNNAFFEYASQQGEKETSTTLVGKSYADVEQKNSKSDDGYVRIDFIKPASKDISWKDEALASIPRKLEQLQDANISLKDVAILVRNNREGVEVAEFLINYASQQKKSNYRYDVISNESLRLDAAITISIVVSALQYLLNSEDLIARAQLSYDYTRLAGKTIDSDLFIVTDRDVFKKKLPPTFIKEQSYLKKLPLFELTETLIDIFELGKAEGELLYLQTFQNIVLDFSTRERSDIGTFLNWWEENKSKKSIQISGEVEAAQIYSIHKSKGLQFKYVLLPFCSWEVDHAPQNSPTLWVQTTDQLYEHHTVVPIKYGALLTDTIFAADYQQEKTRTYLDNLNLLYVAFTRAELGLVICAPHPDVPRMGNTVAAILYNSVTQSTRLTPYWQENIHNWQRGELQNNLLEAVKQDNQQFLLRQYVVTRWRKRMVLRGKADNIFLQTSASDIDQRKQGVILHSLLAHIHVAADALPTFEKALREGLLKNTEMEKVQILFNKLLKQHQFAAWFDGSWKVLTEAPILSPNTPDLRVDRIMLKNGKVIIVDYKTGEPRPSDQEQVLNYMSVVREMNFIDVEGLLVYIHSATIARVEQLATRRKSKDDKNQLGLAI
jgi:ATP-dependent helicase/nuclease subunit A